MFNLHHVSLSVIDLQSTIEFYSNFGFKEVFIWESEDQTLKIAHLKLGDFFLELFAYVTFNAAPLHTKAIESDLPTIGIKHFALNVENIEYIREKLLKNKLAQEILIKEGRTGIKYFFIKDPNGIFLEIVQDNRIFKC